MVRIETRDERKFDYVAHEKQSFVRGGPTLTTFFDIVDEGREDPNTTKSGPSSARQQNAM